MRSNNENWSFGCMNWDWAKPEFESCMFMSQPNIPDKEVHCSVGQEKLEYKIIAVNGE